MAIERFVYESPSGSPERIVIPETTSEIQNASAVPGATDTAALNYLLGRLGAVMRESLIVKPYAGNQLPIPNDGTITDICAPAACVPSLANPDPLKFYQGRFDFDLFYDGGISGGAAGLDVYIYAIGDSGIVQAHKSELAIAALATGLAAGHGTATLPPTLGSALGVTTGAAPLQIYAALAWNGSPAGALVYVSSFLPNGTLAAQLQERRPT